MHYSKNGIIERKLRELARAVYENEQELTEWKTKKGLYSDFGIYSEVEKEYQTISLNEHWSCAEHMTRWFCRKIVVPKSFRGKKTVLLLEFGGEGLVRINGKIRSAITSYIIPQDAVRKRVLIADKAEGGEEIEVEIEAGLNYMEFADYRNRGEKVIEYTLRTAQLVTINQELEDYFFDLDVANRAMQTLCNPIDSISKTDLFLSEQQTPVEKILNMKDGYIYSQIQDALIHSVSCLDFDFSQKELLESVQKASVVLKDKLAAIPHMPHALIKFVGQGHIDTAWLWTIRETVRKTAKTFSNVFALMDQYPEFIFAFSQPQLFSYMKKYYPEIFSRMKEKVENGQLELVGNTWVEMDTNIPSGESLVRQILYGRKFFMEEFGKVSEVFWMPDVFGYSWALPQIIRKSGMKYFYTSKLNNNGTNRFPYSLFTWQGIDGTKVTSYLQRLNYNGDYCPQSVESIYQRFDEKNISDTLLMTFGYGDGGGGPSYEMLERGRRLKEFPGLQRTEIAAAGSFFETTEKAGGDLPVWNDEMYFEHHRGTYTSQANIKKDNRKNELLYRKAEIMCSIAGNQWNMEYPYEEILEGYQMLLTNQFHDILPGSSIGEVYKQAEADNKKVTLTAMEVLQRSMVYWENNINHNAGDIIVFNPLSWDVSGIVKVDIDGRTAEIEASHVPAMGYQILNSKERKERKDGYQGRIAKDTQHFENAYFKIVLNGKGIISSVYDKEAKREVLKEYGNVLNVYEDKPAGETAWNIELEYQNKKWSVTELLSSEILENSDKKAVVRQKRKFHLSEITQDIIIYRNNRRIDFQTHIDWQETEKILKAEFEVDILASKAAYEIQFGAIERPTHWNTSYDKAKFEVCGHKWADLSEGGYGVSILNDCKYGYDIKDSCMRITLLRASIDPDKTADRGSHFFTYSLFPHQQDWRQGNVVNAGYELNVPLEGFACKKTVMNARTEREASFLRMSESNIIIDTLKRAEDGNGWIVRIYESIGKKTNGNMQVCLNCKEAYECNLIEEIERDMQLENNHLEFVINPFEIKTIRLSEEK